MDGGAVGANWELDLAKARWHKGKGASLRSWHALREGPKG